MKIYDISTVEAELKTKDEVAFLTSGASMRPLLRTNKDIVIIQRPKTPLKKGDVALYKKKGVSKLVLHRVIGIQQNGDYIIRGDNTYHKEYIPKNDVIGVMKSVYRSGKYIDCQNSKWYKLYVKTNKLFYPVRWLWYTKIRALLGKLKRKILPLTLVLCLILSLAACNNKKANSFTNSSIADISSEIIEINTPEPPPQKSKNAVLPELLNVDEVIAVTGELNDSKYAEKINELQAILSVYLHNINNISLSVCSVDGSKGLYYNTNAEIFGACTVKAAYTLYACKQMEDGKGALDTQLVYKQEHYEPGTGDMQYSPFGTVFSMETALQKSMSISDNVGYLMTVDYFGRDGYNAFVNDLGCPSLMIKPTVWSLRTKANDLVKIWSEIYNYFETDSEYSKFLYNSCTNTSYNFITASIDGVDYSHKSGHNSTGEWLSHSDAGIVWKDNAPYIIAVITDAPGPTTESATAFARIINIVHNDLF